MGKTFNRIPVNASIFGSFIELSIFTLEGFLNLKKSVGDVSLPKFLWVLLFQFFIPRVIWLHGAFRLLVATIQYKNNFESISHHTKSPVSPHTRCIALFHLSIDISTDGPTHPPIYLEHDLTDTLVSAGSWVDHTILHYTLQSLSPFSNHPMGCLSFSLLFSCRNRRASGYWLCSA